MVRVRILALLVLVSALVCASADTTSMQDGMDVIRRMPLVELPSVSVLVVVIREDTQQKDGLSKDTLKTAVELRLRTLGIKVITEEESLKEPGWPYLYVRVGVMRSNAYPIYFFTNGVVLKQNVTMDRPPKLWITGAITWETSSQGLCPGQDLAKVITENVLEMVDKFANDYLAVNPKK